MEADFFWHLIWIDKITDIREQYPLLPVEEVEEIALMLGYKYPSEGIENGRHVMTTDFLITVNELGSERTIARNVKYAKDLENIRVVEKYEIEKSYWENRRVELKIVTEQSFDRRMARNIAFLMGYYSPLAQMDDPVVFAKTEDRIYAFLVPDFRYHQLNSLMRIVDDKLGLQAGTALSVFFHLAAHKKIPLQMNYALNGSMNLCDIVDWAKWKNVKNEVYVNANYA